LVPIATAAAELGVSVMTLYRWIAAGRVRKFERRGSGPRTYVDKQEIRKLLEPQAVRRRK